MSAPLLDVKHLNAFYGKAQILFDVSLHLHKGEVAALMGTNGAGKSTTLKAVMALIAQRDGAVFFRNQPIAHLQPYQIARLGLGYVPEERRIFTDLTILENLDVGRQPMRADQSSKTVWTPERLFDLFPNLADARNRLGGQLSGGEQQMLTIARTLMGNPLAILLDEPSEGVAPVIADGIIDMILALKKTGVAILLSEQNLSFSKLVADRVYILEKGEIRFTGAMSALSDNPEMRRAHLEF